jgi:hypothetical protein
LAKNSTPVVISNELDGFTHWVHKTYGTPRKKKFTPDEKRVLRPIAEMIAIFDGNAFFGMTRDTNGDDTWYENYLPEAYQIFKGSGGRDGWIMETSWAKEMNHENPAVKEAYEQWQLLKILSRNHN